MYLKEKKNTFITKHQGEINHSTWCPCEITPPLIWIHGEILTSVIVMPVSNVSATPWCSSAVPPKQKYPMSIFMEVNGCRLSDGQLWFDPAPSSSGNICNQQIRDDIQRQGRFTFCTDYGCLISKGQPHDTATVTGNYIHNCIWQLCYAVGGDFKALRELGTAQSWSSSELSHSTWWTFKNGGRIPGNWKRWGAETHLASRKQFFFC